MRHTALLLLLAAGLSAGDFRSLFDGESLDGWQTLPRANGEGSWLVEDGAITPTGKPGDLATVEQFGDFELVFEWRIAELGNSGVFYRVPPGQGPVRAAVEYQLADNRREASQQYPDRRNGAVYGLYPPRQDASKPVGEWNESRIVARATKVEHWLNGVQVAAYDTAGEDWAQRVAAGKFADRENYGRARRGLIALQSHGDRGVMFRSIRLKEFE